MDKTFKSVATGGIVLAMPLSVAFVKVSLPGSYSFSAVNVNVTRVQSDTTSMSEAARARFEKSYDDEYEKLVAQQQRMKGWK